MTEPTATPTLAEAEAALAALRDEQRALNEQIVSAAALVDALREAADAVTLTGRDPRDFWTDAALRDLVIQRDWNHGHDSELMRGFIRSAMSALSPTGFAEYNRELSDDYTTVLRIKPQLWLRYRQDITGVADALLTMLPVLSVDGVMRVDVLEHTCGDRGLHVSLDVSDADTAVLTEGRSDPRTLTLDDALTYLARMHWGYGGPDGGDEEFSAW